MAKPALYSSAFVPQVPSPIHKMAENSGPEGCRRKENKPEKGAEQPARRPMRDSHGGPLVIKTAALIHGNDRSLCVK